MIEVILVLSDEKSVGVGRLFDSRNFLVEY